jgi:hypothetical protein
MKPTKMEQLVVQAAERLEPLKSRFGGQSAVIYAAGPSLPDLVEDWRVKKLPSIAVKDAYTYVPEADILYVTDSVWWNEYKGVPNFAGVKIGYSTCKFPDIVFVQGSGMTGYDHRLGWVRHGCNSGYAATHIAAQLGAKEIFLVGFDLQMVNGKAHYFGNHPYKRNSPSDYVGWVKNFKTLYKELLARQVKLVNATPNSALRFES